MCMSYVPCVYMYVYVHNLLPTLLCVHVIDKLHTTEVIRYMLFPRTVYNVQVLLTQRVDLGCGGVYCSLWKTRACAIM